MQIEKWRSFLDEDVAFGSKKVKNKYVLAAMLVIIIVLAILSGNGHSYIGGVSHAAKAYSQNENGELVQTAEIPRGTLVTECGESVDMDGQKLVLVKTDDETYYVPEENLTSKSNIVREQEVYVRTPVTIYANEEGPEIASYMPKGSKMQVLDYDEMQDDGYIHKYKVSYEDPAGESGEGYVYGKYLVGTQEEADENYNENGEFDKARKAKFRFNLYGGKATSLDYFPHDKPAIEGKKFLDDARTMYINTYAAVHPDEYIKIIKKTDCNAVCIDIKDGQMTYKSDVVKEVSPYSYKQSYTSAEKFKEGVQAYKDAGVYTIGRIVVFNDTRYAKDHPEDCIKSGVLTKKWPSAYSRDVWEYNVRIAIEAVEEFGFDEIQFDYVRFPEASYEISKSGGGNFRNVYGEEKCQAIQNFCFYASDQLREAGAYCSVDVFGESSYGYVTAYGQYWPAISNVVDAISAMPYTDHTGGEGAWHRPYETVRNWAKTAVREQKHIPTPAVARTWITGYDTPYWGVTDYYGEAEMKAQVKGLKKAGLDGGFIPWNVLSNLYKYRQYKGVWNE